jgi:hypothetical protein
MSSTFPLLRFELFKTRPEALEAYKESEKANRNAIWSRSELSVDDGFVRILFREYSDTLLRGYFIDKIVFHYPPTHDELLMARSHINPTTTVQKPIEIISEVLK